MGINAYDYDFSHFSRIIIEVTPNQLDVLQFL